jgi:hypothetical protein
MVGFENDGADLRLNADQFEGLERLDGFTDAGATDGEFLS